MIQDYPFRQHFVKYTLQRAQEMDIPIGYVGYYSDTSDSTFRQYMKGMRIPPPIKLILIAELFECTVNELLGYEIVDVEHHEPYFSPGIETKKVTQYFAEQVRERMRITQVTPEELAERMELSIYTVNDRLQHPRLPDGPGLIAYCDALKCTPSELLGY